MSDIQNVLKGISDLQSDMTDVKVTLAKNTESLEHHVKRTDTLQDIVEPVYKDFLERKAIEEYEKKQREKLVYRLKLPAYIVAAIAAVSTMIAWLASK
jgi:nucleoid-associated protein YgaU